MKWLSLCGLFVVLGLDRALILSAASMSNLYGSEDGGILSFEEDELKKAVIKSDRPWMIQFYSSWCGHCIHFQPIFSEFGARVEGWTDVMAIGVINCAAEQNTQACRDYDIMGYPSVKLFPPNASAEHLGNVTGDIPSVEGLTQTMVKFIEDLQSDRKYAKFFKNKPNLTLMSTWSDLWYQSDKATHALVVLEESSSDTQVVAMDLYAATKHLKTQTIIRRMNTSLYKHISGQLLGAGTIIAVERTSNATNVLNQKAENMDTLTKIALSYVNENNNARLLSLKSNVIAKSPTKVKAIINSTMGIKRRRLTVYMEDLDKALEYALSHEIGQRKVIGGRSLTTLREFLRVLRLYYPKKRPKIHDLFHKLSDWVDTHDDAIRGGDFVEKLNQLNQNVFKKDSEYFGCKGSQINYGGYPCGLWTLWHTLTVNCLVWGAKKKSEDNQEVLTTMVHYVDDFFGCRDCARHFMQMSENGASVTRDVQTAGDAVLWLWKAHNRVNVRLSGDISDDPAFPKFVFPDRKHCPQCYNEVVAGRNLDVEFHRDKVQDFLVEMYHTNLIEATTNEEEDYYNKAYEDESKRDDDTIPHVKDDVDDTNFMPDPDKKRLSKSYEVRRHGGDVTSTWLFTMTDISLCFAIYFGSMLLIVVICYKFCNRRMILKLKKLARTESHNYEPLKMV